jgi:hypothetical protein
MSLSNSPDRVALWIKLAGAWLVLKLYIYSTRVIRLGFNSVPSRLQVWGEFSHGQGGISSTIAYLHTACLRIKQDLGCQNRVLYGLRRNSINVGCWPSWVLSSHSLKSDDSVAVPIAVTNR